MFGIVDSRSDLACTFKYIIRLWIKWLPNLTQKNTFNKNVIEQQLTIW